MPEAEEHLEKAKGILEDAEKCLQQEMLVSTVQNRIYYSLFHAAKAALISRDVDPGSHEGVKIKIGEELVLNGDLDRKWGRFFSTQQSYRERADYRVDVDLERGDLQEYLEETKKFLDIVEEIISD